MAVKRYTPDLSEEVSYEIEASLAYTAAYGAWTVDDALLQNRQDHFTVDPSGNVIAAIQGGVDNGIAATTYKWHVRSWNPDGTLRWVVSNPASPAADQSAIIGVHAVGGNGKFWVVYCQRVAGSITPEDPTPAEQIEVLAARYSSAGVKETTLSLAVLNKILTPDALQNDVFYNVSFEHSLHKLFYSHSNGVSIAVCSAGLRYTPADDTVTYNKHFRCAVITCFHSSALSLRPYQSTCLATSVNIAHKRAFCASVRVSGLISTTMRWPAISRDLRSGQICCVRTLWACTGSQRVIITAVKLR